MDDCDELVRKINALLTKFGQALDDFFAKLHFARALSWEFDLLTFLSDWRQRGLASPTRPSSGSET